MTEVENASSAVRRFGAFRHHAATLSKIIASSLYGLGARAHRTYARRLRPSRGRPACKIVSVGGMTLGGAGKTPVAAAIARGLNARGHRVVLASRGYRGHTTNSVTVVSDGERVHAGVSEAGDESLVLAAHAPGVPVLVGRDRRVVGHHAVSRYGAEILVLDDGFQHHRLARDLDIVCIDGFAGLGNRHVVPWGPLREPISALRAADWICVVDAPPGEKASKIVEGLAGQGVRVVQAHRRPTEIRSLDGRKREGADALSGRSVGLLAGIARPSSMRRTLEGLGANVSVERVFPDHHDYREADVCDLDSNVREWVTSEKDALKILPDWLGTAQLLVLGIKADFDEEKNVFDALESALFSARGSSSQG